MVVDEMVSRAGQTWQRERQWKAEIALHRGVLYCKPLSYMNLSGQPLAAAARFHKITPAEMLVVYDDVSLPLGKLRFRPGGSAGGHNGLRSIIGVLGTQEVPRLRVGIGEATGRGGLVSHVLGRFGPDEEPVFRDAVERAANAVGYVQEHGLAAAMNQFN